MFLTLYCYEMKKIFSHRIKLLVLLAVAAFLFFVSAQRYLSNPNEMHPWDTEQPLDGREMDEEFFAEMRGSGYQETSGLWHFATIYTGKVFGYNESQSVTHGLGEVENWTEDVFYDTRKRVIDELEDSFYLTKEERDHWAKLEEINSKPFVYRCTKDVQNLRDTYQFTLTIACMLIAVFLSGSFAGEIENRTDSLIYSSNYGYNYAVVTKIVAGCTFSLITGILMLIMVHVPVIIFGGLHGLDAPWYMVMPFSEISLKAGEMLFLHTLVYILGCVLTGLLVMMLSLLFGRSMVASGTIFALILFDLFGTVPTHLRVLSQIRYLTPITVLLNSNVPDMRLTKIFGRYLISFQIAPIIYVICGFILIVITAWLFYRRYCWKKDIGR